MNCSRFFSKKRLFGALLAEKNLHKLNMKNTLKFKDLEHYQNQQKFN